MTDRLKDLHDDVSPEDAAGVDRAIEIGARNAIDAAMRVKQEINPTSPFGVIAMGEMITTLFAAQYTATKLAMGQEVADEWLTSFIQVFTKKAKKLGSNIQINTLRRDV